MLCILPILLVPDISFGLTNWSKTGNDSTNGILNDYSNGSQMGLGETQIEQKIQKENKHLLLLSAIVVTINSSLHICSLKSKTTLPREQQMNCGSIGATITSFNKEVPRCGSVFRAAVTPSSHCMINLTTRFINSINLTLAVVLFLYLQGTMGVHSEHGQSAHTKPGP